LIAGAISIQHRSSIRIGRPDAESPIAHAIDGADAPESFENRETSETTWTVETAVVYMSGWSLLARRQEFGP
jgi:hypothetical protein